MFLKRTLALILLCIFCLSPGISAGAADGENLIANPSFESVRADNGFPGSWLRTENVTLNSDKNYVHSGAHSLKFSQTVSAYPYARQTITGIRGGAEYTFGVWVLTMNAKVGIRFRYTCIAADGTWLHDAMGNAGYNGYTGNWYHFTEKFRPPRGTVTMYLQLRISSPGTAYFDDVSMALTDGPEMLYEFGSDSTFIYSDSTRDGNVYAKIDTSYYTELVGKNIEFSLFKTETPDTVLKKQTVKIPADGNVSFSYPVNLLTEKLKEYTVKCSFKPSEKEEIIKTHSLYKVDKPKHIDKDGFFRDENNKIFTPSIMYGVNIDHLDTIKQAGVNAVQGYQSENWLNALHERNMKCFVVLYGGGNSAGSAARLSTTINYVKNAMHHPAVFGWLIFDEPNASKPENLEELEAAYLAIREIDPDHPIVITANAHYDVLHQYTDAIIQDSYPYNNARFTTYPYERNVKAVSESEGRPIYHLIQTFEHLNSFPKAQEVRNMEYASLWAGCKGFGFYKYKDSKVDGTYLDKTPLWEPMVSFAKNEQAILTDIFINNKYQKVEEDIVDDYQWGTWKTSDGYYMILRSKKHDVELSVRIPLTGMHPGWTLTAIGGTPKAMVARDNLATVVINPGDVVLLHAKPKEGVDSILEDNINGKFKSYQGTANDTTYGEQTDGTLWLTSDNNNDRLKNPRIYYTFPQNAKPEAGKDYVFSFHYKPEKEGKSPIILIGKNDPYANKYATLSGDAFRKTDAGNGWFRYEASFTLPEIDTTQGMAFMIASYGGAANGLYDHFAVYEDFNSLAITNEEGEPVTTLKNGDEIFAHIHYVSKGTDENPEEIITALAVFEETATGKELISLVPIKTELKKQTPVLDKDDEVRYYTSAHDFELKIQVPEKKANYSYKLIYWNNAMQSLLKTLTAK